MIYYTMYTRETYASACDKLRKVGIRPMPTPHQEFYVEGELTDSQLEALLPYFSIKRFDSEEVKEEERKRLLESEYWKFRNSEECQEVFSEFIERYNRDRAKVHAAMIEYFRQADRSELIEFLPQP